MCNKEQQALYKCADPTRRAIKDLAMELSPEERCGECIYELMRRGKMSKQELTRRMTQLETCGPSGIIATCYVTHLLLRNVEDTPQRQAFLEQNTHKLRAALLEEESRNAKLVERPAEPAEGEACNACLESLRTVQRVA